MHFSFTALFSPKQAHGLPSFVAHVFAGTTKKQIRPSRSKEYREAPRHLETVAGRCLALALPLHVNLSKTPSLCLIFLNTKTGMPRVPVPKGCCEG